MRVPASIGETTTSASAATNGDVLTTTKNANGTPNNNPVEKLIDIVEKKIRNLEKRRVSIAYYMN